MKMVTGRTRLFPEENIRRIRENYLWCKYDRGYDSFCIVDFVKLEN